MILYHVPSKVGESSRCSKRLLTLNMLDCSQLFLFFDRFNENKTKHKQNSKDDGKFYKFFMEVL